MTYAATRAELPEEVLLLPQRTHARVTEFCFAAMAFFACYVNVLVIPGVQGTIPVFMLAFMSPVLCLRRNYMSALILMGIVWFLLLLGSQLGLSFSGSRAFMDLPLIEPKDRTVIFRSTIFTQSLYLFASLLLFLFVKTHYQKTWMRYVFWGAWFLVIYGLIDWFCASFFGFSLSFLSNRRFTGGGEERAASLAQRFQLGGGLSILRLKGFTEEPSRYATLAVVYLCLAITHGRKLLSVALLLTLFRNTATTGFLGLGAALGVLVIFGYRERASKAALAISGLAILLAIVTAVAFPEVIEDIILPRLTGEHKSAQLRVPKLFTPFPVFASLPLLNKLFGVGIGACWLAGGLRMFINCGLVGVALGAWLFFFPIAKLRKSHEDLGLLAAVVVLLLIHTFISAAIYSTPLMWLVLGMAYARIAALGDETSEPMVETA